MNNPTIVALRRHLKKTAIQTGLEAVSMASDFGLVSHSSGLGAIFTLHRVEPKPSPHFDPSAHLSVTPDFLDKSISALRKRGYQFVSLADLPKHLADPDPLHPVLAMTLDDGYRNNIEYALPVFKKHNVPFTVFACSGFVERSNTIWWETARELVTKMDAFSGNFGLGERQFATGNLREKYAAFDQIGRDIMTGKQLEAVGMLDNVARKYGICPEQITDDLIMNSKELVRLAQEPLASIGAHTVSHPILSSLSNEMLREELQTSKDHIEALTDQPAHHFAYPYGRHIQAGPREFEVAKKIGFELAVTTEPNILTAQSSQKMHQLNRISLNGYYQKTSYVDALASGIVFKFLKSA